MGVVPPAEFARRLRGLDAAARARFLAAVCEARGRETSVDGRRVRVAAGPAREAHTLWVAPDRRRLSPPADVDVAVVAARDGRLRRSRDYGVETLGPGELRDRLLYGLDRETAGRLCRRHLGCDLDGWPDGTDREGATGPWTLLAGTGEDGAAATVGVAVAVAVVVAVAIAAVATGLGPTVAGPVATGDGDGEGASTPAGTAASTVPPAAGDGDRRSEVERGADALGPLPIEWSTDDGYPPGVTPAGVTNAATLARAHADAVRPPYAWRVTYREVRNGTVRGELSATVRVAGEARYVASVESNGSFDAPPPAGVPLRERYADGAREYVLRSTGTGDGGAALALRGPPGPTAERYVGGAGLLVRRTLGANDTAVAAPVDDDGGRLYRVRATGSGAPGTRNATGRAIVTELGLVEALYHAYTPVDHPDTRAVVTFEYRIGAVTVERPAWLEPGDAGASVGGDDRGNETAGRRTASATATPTP